MKPQHEQAKEINELMQIDQKLDEIAEEENEDKQVEDFLNLLVSPPKKTYEPRK